MLFVVCELVCYGICVMIIVFGIFVMLMMVGLLFEVQESLGVIVLFLLCFGDFVEFVVLVCYIVENFMFNGEVIWLDGVLCMVLK